MISYICHGLSSMKRKHWEGQIHLIHTEPPYEAEVIADGSTFHLLFGSHAYGNYICIPNWNVGSELASLTDEFWNTERLIQYSGLSKTNACSVASALAELSKYI
ncbi:MAG: hypothetical protein PHN80_06875 [Hespellia sp.]|nr:hypothetical protein [Hespellia sp.]MDD4434257.1 hypothetical protein [Parabacteroides sp.]